MTMRVNQVHQLHLTARPQPDSPGSSEATHPAVPLTCVGPAGLVP